MTIAGDPWRLPVLLFYFSPYFLFSMCNYFPPAKVAPFFLFPNFLYIISKFFIHYLHLSGHCSLIISIYFHLFPPVRSFISTRPPPFSPRYFPPTTPTLSTHYPHLSLTHSFTIFLPLPTLLLFFYPTSFTLFTPYPLFFSPFIPFPPHLPPF